VPGARVTGLDKFSPIVYHGHFFVNRRLSRYRYATFYYGVNSYVLILTKNRLGYNLGDFFTSGRPDWCLLRTGHFVVRLAHTFPKEQHSQFSLVLLWTCVTCNL
jgi:hypothetical protein